MFPSPISCACILLSLGSASAATTYTFTKIVDNTGSFGSFSGFSSDTARPAINDSGTVAFFATLSGGTFGVYSGSGGAVTTIIDSSGMYDGFGNPSINSSGQVGILATFYTPAFGTAALIGDGSTITTVASTPNVNNSPPDPPGPVYDVSINDSGDAVFTTRQAGPPVEFPILIGNGTTLSTFYDGSGPLGPNFGATSINNNGVVSFAGNYDGGGSGIFTYDGTTLAVIVDDLGPYAPFTTSSGNARSSINDSGEVATRAVLDGGGGQAIIKGDGTTTTVVADTTGDFVSFKDPAINNTGMVSFEAKRTDGTFGLYTGSDPAADKVIESGDALFGSTVFDFSGIIDPFGTGPYSMNSSGQIAFRYRLMNGEEGIAIATAEVTPEPSTFVLTAIAAVMVLGKKRRWR